MIWGAHQIKKTQLLLRKFQLFRGYFPGARDKGQISIWERSWLQKRCQNGMMYWHYLRETFKFPLIYLNNWNSHRLQHVNIVSNKWRHISQMVATQHMSGSLPWSESCCTSHSGTPCIPFALHLWLYCNLFIKSTLNMILYQRKTLILKFFKMKFNCHLLFEASLKLLRQNCLLWPVQHKFRQSILLL